MKGKNPDMVCFSAIELADPIIINNHVKTNITIKKTDGESSNFQLMLKYNEKMNDNYLSLIRLAFTMPLLNYGLFSKKFILHFQLCKSDILLLKKLNNIFSRDIYVNKILRRRTNYILPTYLPDPKKVIPADAEPKSDILSSDIQTDKIITTGMKKKSCGILSSGGKESLLTYGLLNEIGCTVYPFYINESGGHWRTAIPAYKYHTNTNDETQRVWTNIDRFYVFMLDNLKFIRKDHRNIWADTYPIRLCIFPYYVFALLPLFAEKKIGNLLIGSEFDDTRSKPKHLGIEHYFGVYDQHQDYDHLMNQWYKKRLPGLIQWSAVRNISGLVEEKILTRRYPKLAKLQRSCHSCHFEKNEIVPCGKCSKCMGVLLFLLANDLDPKIMKFKQRDIDLFAKRVNKSNLRLDDDEKQQSFNLLGKKDKTFQEKPIDHVEKIHHNRANCDINLIPDHLCTNLLEIIQHYTAGFCELKNEKWVTINKINLIT
jgi:hypothetical protein